MSNPSVALIGSFRKHLPEMQEAINVFTANNILVVNPLDTEPLEPGIDFVRFASDDMDLSDAGIQLQALDRILGATAVYVVCPGGYIGKTTSYELGWIDGREQAVYFSEQPDEWFASDGMIIGADQLAENLNQQ